MVGASTLRHRAISPVHAMLWVSHYTIPSSCTEGDVLGLYRGQNHKDKCIYLSLYTLVCMYVYIYDIHVYTVYMNYWSGLYTTNIGSPAMVICILESWRA